MRLSEMTSRSQLNELVSKGAWANDGFGRAALLQTTDFEIYLDETGCFSAHDRRSDCEDWRELYTTQHEAEIGEYTLIIYDETNGAAIKRMFNPLDCRPTYKAIAAGEPIMVRILKTNDLRQSRWEWVTLKRGDYVVRDCEYMMHVLSKKEFNKLFK